MGITIVVLTVIVLSLGARSEDAHTCVPSSRGSRCAVVSDRLTLQ